MRLHRLILFERSKLQPPTPTPPDTPENIRGRRRQDDDSRTVNGLGTYLATQQIRADPYFYIPAPDDRTITQLQMSFE